jgi:hypothetical protein
MVVFGWSRDGIFIVSIESGFLAVSLLRRTQSLRSSRSVLVGFERLKKVQQPGCGSRVIVCLLFIRTLQMCIIDGSDAELVLSSFHVGPNCLPLAPSLLVGSGERRERRYIQTEWAA